MRRCRPAPHFNKLECFCFNEYTLEPGESQALAGGLRRSTRKLPKDVTTITLSYTFFEVGGKMPPAPAGTAAAAEAGRA